MEMGMETMVMATILMHSRLINHNGQIQTVMGMEIIRMVTNRTHFQIIPISGQIQMVMDTEITKTSRAEIGSLMSQHSGRIQTETALVTKKLDLMEITVHTKMDSQH